MQFSFSRRTSLHAALAAAVACMLTAPAWAETVTGVALDASFKPAERATTMVKVLDSTNGGLKGLQRAAIGSFQVEFVTKGAAAAKSYEIGRSGSSSTNMMITVVGVGTPDFQAITDRLHADFVRDLKAMGIEVVPVEKLLAAAAYQKMAATGKPSPAETRTSNTWSTVFAPAGMAVYGIGSSSTAIGMLAGFTAMSDVSATMFGNLDLIKELDAALITVRMVVNFVNLKSSDSSWFSRSSGTATVSGEVGPSVAYKTSMMSIQRPADIATMTLEAPLVLDDTAFTEVKDTSSVAANIGLALLSAAIGKGGSATAVEKEAVADPAKYRVVVGDGVGAVREMFMERVRAGK